MRVESSRNNSITIEEEKKDLNKSRRQAVMLGIAYSVATVALTLLTGFFGSYVVKTFLFLKRIGFATPINRLPPRAARAVPVASFLCAYSLLFTVLAGVATCFTAKRGYQAVTRTWKQNTSRIS